MSILTREIFASAASSPHGLTVGTLADPVRLTWREVHEQAKRMAGGLAARGVGRHGSVAVLAADAADVAPLAQAIWMRRAALTMLQQPTPRTDLAVWLDDTVRAIRMISADVVVVGEPFLMALDHLAAHGLAVCTVESLRGAEPIEPDGRRRGGYRDAAAHLGFDRHTEGRGDQSRQSRREHRGDMRRAGHRHRPGRMLSWLPLSHDMGMIAFLCVPMQLGARSRRGHADQFLRRPIIWAELISKHRATITSGPNFAYSMLARVLERADPAAIDLSSLRVAVNGAEPIDHRDIAEFRCRRRPFRPAAERTDARLRARRSHAGRVVRRAARPADLRPRLAAGRLGKPTARSRFRMTQTDVAAHRRAWDSRSRAWTCASPATERCRGPERSAPSNFAVPRSPAAISLSDGVVPLARDDGWFDSGDLGYLDEQGRIYVCGRTKDLIVVAGKNLYPHDIERAAATVDGVRKGCVIALRVDAEREGFAVLAEVHNADDEDVRLRISRDITARVNHHVGHAPREVRLFPAGALPKTPSGKLRRNSARELLPQGTRGADTTEATSLG